MKNPKMFSKTMANPSLAYCYIEECINEPDNKMYRYYHWDSKHRMYSRRTLRMDEAMLVNHLMYNSSEQLQQLLNDCCLYGYVMRTVRKYHKAVDSQTSELCKADQEMQLALRLGDMDKYAALERSNRHKAEEMLRDSFYAA